MYTEHIKFQFNDNISDPDRLAYLTELFKTLEAQSIEGEHLVKGGLYKYQIKHNGKVKLSSFYPASTSIIKKFIKFKKREGIVK